MQSTNAREYRNCQWPQQINAYFASCPRFSPSDVLIKNFFQRYFGPAICTQISAQNRAAHRGTHARTLSSPPPRPRNSRKSHSNHHRDESSHHQAPETAGTPRRTAQQRGEHTRTRCLLGFFVLSKKVEQLSKKGGTCGSLQVYPKRHVVAAAARLSVVASDSVAAIPRRSKSQKSLLTLVEVRRIFRLASH